MALVGALMGAAITLLVVYGIAVTTSLAIPSYFHSPGEGYQPLDMSVGQHIAGHLRVSVVAMLVLSLLTAIGFALGRRAAPAPAGGTA